MKLDTKYLDDNGVQYTVIDGKIKVGGYLYLEGTQITALPDGLTVGGYLDGAFGHDRFVEVVR